MTEAPRSTAPAGMYWTGWVITGLLSALMLFSASGKFGAGEQLVKGMEHLGWPMRFAVLLGITEIVCTLLYAIPQTSVLGAILLTGYLGGAIATHARLGEGFLAHIILGVLIWLGIYLRDRRLWTLVPLRRG